MNLVSQLHTVEVDDDGIILPESERGDCWAACLASIFEMPIDRFPRTSDTQWLFRWLDAYFPGVTCEAQHYGERKDDVFNTGFWIATVESSRFREACNDCSPERETSSPPWYRRDECPWCQGSGYAWGLHAVVMKGRRLEWDPHPKADWDTPLVFRGQTTFIVKDPARLAPRVLPAEWRPTSA